MDTAIVLRVLTVLLVSSVSFAQDIVVQEGLAVSGLPRARRSPVHVDPVEAMLVAGSWRTPRAGEELAIGRDTTRSWQVIKAGEDGWFRGPALRGGYVVTTVELDNARTMILDAQGHGLVYVNGVPRAGDPYNYGFVRLPVPLRAGENELLFRVTRGRLRATLREPRAPITLDTGDMTLPDLVEGEAGIYDAAVVVTNATGQWQRDLSVVVSGGGLPTIESVVPPIGPYALRKIPFRVNGAVEPATETCEVTIELRDGPDVIDQATFSLRVRRPDDRHVRTFVSDIDGSVQYYAVTPAVAGEQAGGQPGIGSLVLTLHGAGVEAHRQAAVYTPKTWAHVVAPTNRRPYGFDWEDWGRLDALEVLDLAMRRYPTDPRRVYLTGHSMGGHGVWHLGVTFPDRFAAIGPSAGWSSFFTYAGGTAFAAGDSIGAILARAQQSSVTRDLARNYMHHGVYILHGEKDDNVPVEQARAMRDVLDDFHTDLAYHEQPGAGHWWGDQCCDWGPMFDFFADRVRPSPGRVDRIEFLTANPGISASSHWACIESQVTPLALSGIEIDLDRTRRQFEIKTTNVASLRIEPNAIAPGSPVEVTIDGQSLGGRSWSADEPMRLVRDGSRWRFSNAPAPPGHKGPQRYGPFKDVFRRRATLVYGTAGSPDENDWAYRKARYDAETFWYRGNGAFEIVADSDFDPEAEVDRNVILYGNADTNTAWTPLLADSPVRVGRDGVVIAGRMLAGDDLGCLFIRPRPGSSVACVGVVSGTGPRGRRLVERLPYFVSGVHYPDCIVIGPEMLTDDAQGGIAGIRVVGIFGPDWSVERGDFAGLL